MTFDGIFWKRIILGICRFSVFEYELVHRQRIIKWGKLPFEPVAIPIRLLRLFSHRALLPFTGPCWRWADNVPSPRRTSLLPVSRCRERGAEAQPGARWQRRTAPGPPQPERAGRCGSAAPASAGSWPGHCCALLCSFRAWERRL